MTTGRWDMTYLGRDVFAVFCLVGDCGYSHVGSVSACQDTIIRHVRDTHL